MSDKIRERIALAMFEQHYGMKLHSWSDETRDFWLKRANAILSLIPSCIDEKMVEAGAREIAAFIVGRGEVEKHWRSFIPDARACLTAFLGLLGEDGAGQPPPVLSDGAGSGSGA